MRYSILSLFILTFFSRVAIAVVGGSALAHCYEAIYLYYGYLADIAINGDSRTLGTKCTPKTGTVCTFWEFARSIEDPVYAAQLVADDQLPAIGDTTRPGDLQDLAAEMLNSGFNRYDDYTMFGKKVYHSKVLLTATNILIDARDNHPNVLSGGLLVQARRCLLHSRAERENDMLADKIKTFIKEFGKVKIVEKTEYLEDDLIVFQDIDWEESAKETAADQKSNELSVMEGFTDFGVNLGTDTNIPKVLGDHVRIAQSIEAQTKSLGSLESCRALG